MLTSTFIALSKKLNAKECHDQAISLMSHTLINQAIDTVRHNHLIQSLGKKNPAMRDIRITNNLFYNQRAAIEKIYDFSEDIETERE